MQKFKDFSLSRISWMQVGGNAKWFIIVDNITELTEVFKEYNNEHIIVLGSLSNTIVRDGGFDGVVIKLDGDFKKIYIDSNNKTILHTGCGASSKEVAKFAMENNLGGLEFLYTIPGTIGGNIKMNAGCYGSEIKDVLCNSTYLDYQTRTINHIDAKEMIFQYRKTLFPKNVAFLQASFQCHVKDKAEIKSTMNEMNQKRLESQPQKVKTCGSTFKNGTTYKAWELIDKAGLRGYEIGGAKMSDKHCNFMINNNNATATDMETLTTNIIDIVYNKFKVKLELEIDIIGKKLP